MRWIFFSCLCYLWTQNLPYFRDTSSPVLCAKFSLLYSSFGMVYSVLPFTHSLEDASFHFALDGLSYFRYVSLLRLWKSGSQVHKIVALQLYRISNIYRGVCNHQRWFWFCIWSTKAFLWLQTSTIINDMVLIDISHDNAVIVGRKPAGGVGLGNDLVQVMYFTKQLDV